MESEQSCPSYSENIQNLINAMNEGYAVHEILCDEGGSPVNYRFLQINSAFERLTGLKGKDIIGRTVKDVLPEIDPFWIDVYGRVALTGVSNHFENYDKVLDKYFKVSVFTPVKGQFTTLFIDMTEQKKSELLMKKHKLLFECAQDAVLYIRSDGRIVDANASACSLYGYTLDELLERNIHQIRHSSVRDQFEAQMQQADETGVIFESLHVRKDGSEFPTEVSAKGTMIGDEKIRIHIIRDISGRKLVEEKLFFLANHDSLTGVPNRTYIMRELAEAIETAARENGRLAFLLFDIDKFKHVNDAYGHQAGDVVLKTVAARIKAVVRNVDMLARLGGDEFTILMPGIKSKRDIQTVVQRMFDALKEPVRLPEADLTIQISVGVAIYPIDGSDRRSLLKHADTAMYEAKKEPGNTFRF